MYIYRIFSIKRPGVYLLKRIRLCTKIGKKEKIIKKKCPYWDPDLGPNARIYAGLLNLKLVICGNSWPLFQNGRLFEESV